MSNSVDEQGCIYLQHENGIHEFIFTGEGGLDKFFDILVKIISEAPTDSTLRYIVDNSRTIPGGKSTMSELVKRFQKLERRFPERARGRTAILHGPNLLLNFANTFISALAPGQDKTRFFRVEKRDEAIEWLLSDT